jgi:hypothetical protein
MSNAWKSRFRRADNLLDRPSDEAWQWPPDGRAKSRVAPGTVMEGRLSGIVCEEIWRDEFCGNPLIIGKMEANILSRRGHEPTLARLANRAIVAAHAARFIWFHD